MLVVVKINGMVVDKDFYSVEKIKELNKSGFIVEKISKKC